MEKVITTCDRCLKGEQYGKNTREMHGLTDDGPLGYGARMTYNEPGEKINSWGDPKVLILCRECLTKLLPILSST
jgi:hypothetical protein